jgi:hypothetical protein
MIGGSRPASVSRSPYGARPLHPTVPRYPNSIPAQSPFLSPPRGAVISIANHTMADRFTTVGQ